MNCLVFTCGGVTFGLLAEEVEEVIFLPTLLRPPLLPWCVEGFVMIGQRAVAAVHLDRLMELPESALSNYSQIIIVPTDGRNCGWLIDGSESVIPLSSEQLIPLDGSVGFQGCVAASFEYEGRIAYLLVSSLILLEQERQQIERLAQEIEGRLHRMEPVNG